MQEKPLASQRSMLFRNIFYFNLKENFWQHRQYMWLVAEVSLKCVWSYLNTPLHVESDIVNHIEPRQKLI